MATTINLSQEYVRERTISVPLLFWKRVRMDILKIAARISSTKIDLQGPFEFDFTSPKPGKSLFETYIDIPFGVSEHMVNQIVDNLYGDKDDDEKNEIRRDLSNSLGETQIIYSIDETGYSPHQDSREFESPDGDEEIYAEIEIERFSSIKMSEENKKRLSALGINDMIKKADWERISDIVRDRIGDYSIPEDENYG